MAEAENPSGSSGKDSPKEGKDLHGNVQLVGMNNMCCAVLRI